MNINPSVNQAINVCMAIALVASLVTWSLRLTPQIQTAREPKLPQKKHEPVKPKNKENDKSIPGKKSGQESIPHISIALSPAEMNMWRDPEYQKNRVENKSKQSDKYYEDLYRILEVDDKTIESLRELLARRAIALTDLTLSKSGEESDAELDTVRMESENKLAGLLGMEKYHLLDEYENTIMQRNQIKQFRVELEFSDEPLTVEQEMALLPALQRLSEIDPFTARKRQNMSRIDPTIVTINTMSVTDATVDLVKDVLTQRQLDVLNDLRKENLKLINYPWLGLGKQMRKP